MAFSYLNLTLKTPSNHREGDGRKKSMVRGSDKEGF